MVKNLPSSAGVTGSVPGLGRTHMPGNIWACEPQLLSPSSRAHRLKLLSPREGTTKAPMPYNLCPVTREATGTRSSCTATRKSLSTATKAPYIPPLPKKQNKTKQLEQFEESLSSSHIYFFLTPQSPRCYVEFRLFLVSKLQLSSPLGELALHSSFTTDPALSLDFLFLSF